MTRLLEETVALALYLCSEEPDVATIATSVNVGATSRPRRRPGSRTMEVLDVGYRIGAALRTAAAGARASATGDEAETRRRPVPHLRRAHFHLYWYGPRSDPAGRVPKVRWLAPVPVNGHVVLTVRDVETRDSRI